MDNFYNPATNSESVLNGDHFFPAGAHIAKLRKPPEMRDLRKALRALARRAIGGSPLAPARAKPLT